MFGSVETLVVIAINWHQLAQLAQPATPGTNDIFYRWSFIVAGIALLTKGVKDLMEGIDIVYEADQAKKAMPQSTESSAAPSPD
jgi:hypothetical protein